MRFIKLKLTKKDIFTKCGKFLFKKQQIQFNTVFQHFNIVENDTHSTKDKTFKIEYLHVQRQRTNLKL